MSGANDYKATALSIGTTPLEMFKYRKEQQQREALEFAGMPNGSNLDANLWLPFAAKEYKISGDLRDYVLVPVPILITDMPNTNGDSASAFELTRFQPDVGMQSFKTFRGKPTFYEHDNQDILKAKGVIFDAYMRPLRGFGGKDYWKLILLLGYDRTKDPLLAQSLLDGSNNAFSLGFYFKSYLCSICGQRFGEGGSKSFCEHTKPKLPTHQIGNRLAYRMCETIRGFETSIVGSPAYISAINSTVLQPKLWTPGQP